MRRRVRTLRLAGILLVLAGAPLSGAAAEKRPAPAVPSPALAQARASWEGYKREFLQKDGRVIRRDQHDDTVSEGQTLALLRAVWMNDQPTFDICYQWTLNNISRQKNFGDHLLAWRWGKSADGSWKVLDWTTAADADQDFALALLFAARRWKRPSLTLPDYQEEARSVLADILALETWETDGQLFLRPGNWNDPSVHNVLNPSYMAPAWYRIFFALTRDRRWLRLADSSYWLLEHASQRLDATAGVGLPPDWCAYAGGLLMSATGFSRDFTWDAMRVPWRIALDASWFREPRARRFLAGQMYPFLNRQWQQRRRLDAGYSYQGKPLANTESAASYAMDYFVFNAAGSAERAAVLARVSQSFVPDGGYYDKPDNYFQNSFAWLASAQAAGLLVNLARAPSSTK